MRATCTWGEGPDVVLSLEGTSLVLGEHPDFNRNRFLHGVITKGEIDLTADQAQELGNMLIDTAKQAKWNENIQTKKYNYDKS